MSLTRAAIGFIGQCDYCEDTVELDADSTTTARKELKDKGWIANKDGEACCDCRTEFKE